MTTSHAPTAAPRPESLRVLEDPRRVRAALTPLRLRLLHELREPASASGLAGRLGTTRQRLAYHLRVLEDQGLVRLVEERRRRGCTERLLQTTARALVVDPEVLGALGTDADEIQDRFSSAYLVAAAARTLGDVAALREEARAAGKRLATITQETEVHFRSPAALRAFTEELAETVTRLVAKYDHATDGGRPHRLMMAIHPRRIGRGPSPDSGDER